MMKLLSILLAIHCVFSMNTHVLNQENGLKKSECDSQFKEFVDLEMMKDFVDSDLKLKEAYEQRTQNMTMCLRFYTKYLIQLEGEHSKENFGSIETDDIEDFEKKHASFSVESQEIKKDNKRFWKRSERGFKNKNF